MVPFLAGIYPVLALAALPVSLMKRQRASAMKSINLLAAATALVMVATPSFAANWVLVGESDSKSVHYYDVDTIQRSGNQVTVWERSDNSRDKTVKHREIRSRRIYDCMERTVTLLRNTVYYPDGTNQSYNYEKEQETDSIIPGTMGEASLEAVCR